MAKDNRNKNPRNADSAPTASEAPPTTPEPTPSPPEAAEVNVGVPVPSMEAPIPDGGAYPEVVKGARSVHITKEAKAVVAPVIDAPVAVEEEGPEFDPPFVPLSALAIDKRTKVRILCNRGSRIKDDAGSEIPCNGELIKTIEELGSLSRFSVHKCPRCNRSFSGDRRFMIDQDQITAVGNFLRMLANNSDFVVEILPPV